jgi:hypothetical protein
MIRERNCSCFVYHRYNHIHVYIVGVLSEFTITTEVYEDVGFGSVHVHVFPSFCASSPFDNTFKSFSETITLISRGDLT